MQTSAMKSLLSNCRVQLFFCKENANERNESLLSNCRVQLFFCKYYEIFLFYASFWAFSFVFSKEKCKFAEKNKIAYGKVYQSIF